MSSRSSAEDPGEGIVFEEESADLLLEGSGATALGSEGAWRPSLEAIRREAGLASRAREAALLEMELDSPLPGMGRGALEEAGGDPDERTRLSTLAYALATMRLAAGDEPGAVATLEKARALDPSFEPFWGLAYQQARRDGRWPDVVAVLGRALQRPGLEPRDRADLLLELGFSYEHKLGDAAEAAEAYRRAARELPRDTGAGLALYLLGLRRGDPSVTAEGLGLLLETAVEPEARLGLLLAWAEVERRRRSEDVTALERVRAALAEACATVTDEGERSGLFVAMTALFGAAPTPAERRAVMETLLGLVPDAPPKAALLRAHARLLRDEVRDPREALACLRRALALEPRRTSLWSELCGVAFELGQPEVVVAAWTQVASTGEVIAVGEAARDFALSVGIALGRGGRWAEASGFLMEHAELSAEDADVFALLSAITARAARSEDFATLARLWEDQASRLGRRERDPHALATAADMLVVAATVHRRLGANEKAERLLRRACGLLPGHRPAFEALLDLQRRERRWLQLADTWEEEIERLLGLEVPPPDRDLRVQKGLEELLAVCRDELGDLRWADRVAERLVNQVGGVRALVRRLGVLVASGVAGQGQGPPAALWAALAQAAGDEGVAARLRLFAAEAFLREGDRERARELAERAYQADVRGSTSSCAVALLERLAPSEDRRLAALEGELASLLQAGGQSAEVRTARFRLSSAALAAGAIERALAALEPLLAEGDPLACAWSWDVVRRLGKPALSTALLEAPTGRSEIDPSPRPLRAEAPADRGEAWERAGQADRAQASFAAALAEGFDADAALGLYRLAARSEDVAANVATLRQLAAGLEGEAREALAREAELLAAVAGLPSDSARTADALDATDARSEEERALLGWLQGVRRRDHRGTAEGLLGLAVLAAADEGTDAGAADAASGLLLRAVARARVAGPSHAAAVLARAWDYEPAEALLTPALSDLPLAKAALPDAGVIARQRRAATAPVDLAVSLLMEAAQACEEGGDGDGAVSLYGEVLARAPATLDALWALRRHAGERGDRHGWARVTVRLASVVRNRTRAATLWVEASSAWEDLGRIDEAIACLWQAVARVGATDEVSLRLPGLLETQGDDEGLETWLGHRLLRVTEPSARIALLWDRGSLRRDRLGKHDAAAADFKRILKLDPGHRPALEALAHLAEAAEAWDAAAHAWDRLLDRALRLAQPSLPLSLSLANALARAGDELRARQVLEEAIRAAPDEEAPREQLVGLLKMAGAWGEAIEGLQGLVERASTPARKAAFEEEIGVILLEQGRDPDAALAAFLRAGTSDPIGGGWDRALALAEASGREARDHVLASGLGLMRQAVQSTPLHVDLLRRFVGWLEKAARAVGPDERVRLAEEALTARQLLGVMGEEPSAPALGIGSGRGLAVPGFWNRLVPASAQGFALEIWPLLVDAAAELHPESTPRLPDVKRRRIAPQAEPSLAWIEALAVALGLPTLPIVFVAVPGAKAFAVELPEPTLCVSMDAPPRLDVPADRFAVGRALGLLHDRAAMLEALPPPQLVALFGAAAFVAGTRPTLVAPGAFKNLEGEAKRLGKAMSRKSRRALELEASRLGSENIDAEAFQQGLLATADRLGLLLAGDLGAALASRLATPPPLSVELLAHPALVPLVRFALSEEHILLRHEAGLGGEAK